MFAIIALIISIGTLVWAWRNSKLIKMIAGGLFADGGLANAYERFLFGGWFDYINVSAQFYKIHIRLICLTYTSLLE